MCSVPSAHDIQGGCGQDPAVGAHPSRRWTSTGREPQEGPASYHDFRAGWRLWTVGRPG